MRTLQTVPEKGWSFLLANLALLLGANTVSVQAAIQTPQAESVLLDTESVAAAPLELSGPWLYLPTDLPPAQVFADSFPPTSWQILEDTSWAPRTRPPRWTGIGWFRHRIEVAPDLVNRPLALLIEHPGASEIYLDGQLLTRFGRVAAGPGEEQPFDPQGEPFPIVFTTPGPHTLALRYSCAAASNERLAPWLLLDRGAGFRARLDLLARSINRSSRDRTQVLLLNVAGAALAFGFGVLHLLIFLFHPRHRGNLWFALFAFFLGANGGIESILTFGHFGLWGSSLLRLLNLFAAGGLLASLLHFLSLLRATPPVGITWLSFTFVPIALSSRIPALVVLFTPLLTLWFLSALLVSLWLAIDASRRRSEGAGTLAVSGAGWLVLAATESGKHLGWLGQSGELIGFWTALLLILTGASIFLARRIAGESRELETLALHLEDRVASRTAELHRSERRALAASQAKSTFLATMSHEIRTPMNAITGLAELLATSELPPEALHQAATLHRSAISMLTLIDEVLDLSRIEAGHLEIASQPFSPRTLVDESIDLFATLAEGKGLRLEHDSSPTLPRCVLADRARLRQILVNLLGNACKFTLAGSIRVETQWRDDHLGLTVRDTGIGIPEESLDRLFDPFYQVDGTRGRRFEGSGLGLSISRQLAEAMGGSLEVESSLGKGSAFTLRVPAPEVADDVTSSRGTREAAPAPGSQAPTAEERPTESAAVGRQARSPIGLRILLAEDNPVNQMVTRSMLERLGHRFEAVESGVEVLERLGERAFDVLLLDLHMPGMDGFEVARRIRGRSDLPQPHLVAFTASVLEEDRERCRLAGMDDFLSKPAQLDRLAAVLENVWGPRGGAFRTTDDSPDLP